MIIHIGFTGTQIGMTDRQRNIVADFMDDIPLPVAGHHGDCIGADAQFDKICRELDWQRYIHPPDIERKRAFCVLNLSYGDVLYKPRPYLDRNHDIVDACDLVIVAPKEEEEQLRSGTWATYRYAQKMGRFIKLVTP